VKKEGCRLQIVFRRWLPRLGYKKAIWAIAHRLCRLIWKVLHDGVRYIEKGLELNPKAQKERAAASWPNSEDWDIRSNSLHSPDRYQSQRRDFDGDFRRCDALSRNVPKLLPTGVEILLANCLAHGRRQFIEVAANFPDECRYVLEMLGQVYGHDAETRELGLTADERLRLHQERSGPVMDQLRRWLEAQFAERKTEPNSGLGKAITYLLRHWRPLTLFLRIAGAPVDNNIVERALKRAVLHRKNALFYRTLNGAQVGDLFMSLIHTCQLCGVNSFDYLIELQRHAQDLLANVAKWMPWNYRETLARG